VSRGATCYSIRVVRHVGEEMLNAVPFSKTLHVIRLIEAACCSWQLDIA
jgi:hypothetical protein